MFHSQLTGTPVGNTGKLQGHSKCPISLLGQLRHSKCQMPLLQRHSKCPMAWPAKTQQVSMPLLSPLMQVSLTIKDTMVPGRGARLTTPCKRTNGHTSASRSRSLFQQHNGRSVKCRTTEDTCPRVSCILGVYKSK